MVPMCFGKGGNFTKEEILMRLWYHLFFLHLFFLIQVYDVGGKFVYMVSEGFDKQEIKHPILSCESSSNIYVIS